jgi:CDP-glucose 4,6-dehydratase
MEGMDVMPNLQRDFWANRRVLVTGHTGFKGSWLSLWLQSLGTELLGIALPAPTNPSHFDLARVADKMNHILADVRDAKAIKDRISAFSPEVIFHLAAQPLVRESYRDPVGTLSTNIMGTVNVLEAARNCASVKAIVNVTTDKCYDNRGWAWAYREIDALGGDDPYSSSKACSEMISETYRKSFFQSSGIALATARAGNVIGGGDWAPERLVPDALAALAEQRPIEIRNPNFTRPWQHVLEPISGYLLLAEKLWAEGQAYASAWNFGPSDEDAKSVQWVAEALCARWSSHTAWTRQEGRHPHEAQYLKLDTSKTRSALGWAPRWSLSDALDKTVSWYQSWVNGCDMRSVGLRQIAEYEARDFSE